MGPSVSVLKTSPVRLFMFLPKPRLLHPMFPLLPPLSVPDPRLLRQPRLVTIPLLSFPLPQRRFRTLQPYFSLKPVSIHRLHEPASSFRPTSRAVCRANFILVASATRPRSHRTRLSCLLVSTSRCQRHHSTFSIPHLLQLLRPISTPRHTTCPLPTVCSICPCLPCLTRCVTPHFAPHLNPFSLPRPHLPLPVRRSPSSRLIGRHNRRNSLNHLRQTLPRPYTARPLSVWIDLFHRSLNSFHLPNSRW